MLKIKVTIDKKLIQNTASSKPRITIGRSDNNDIILPHKLVSRLHMEIVEEGGYYRLCDHSSNGTYLDNVRIERAIPLPKECSIGIYPFTIHCTAYSDEATHPLIDLDQGQEEQELSPPIPEPTAQHLYFGLLVGEDPSIQKVYQAIQRVADTPASVLIRGESGTGKELVAQAIHKGSSRRSAPFLALDCAAIPENLVESELFGFEKGAFTGASASKKGWFEEANGGTVFLDEIGELSLAAQAKLLRFLQDRSYTRLGGTRQLKTDVRLVTATNKDLEKAIHSTQFRSDLYFRLRVIQITLPPLRNRRSDIPLLVEHALTRITKDHGLSQLPILTAQAQSKLKEYHWPGNIRQLENVLYNAFINTPAPHLIDEKDLDLQSDIESSERSFDDSNRQLLLATLKDCNWNTAIAAKVLKVSRGTIYYKCKRLGIEIKQLSR